jgi:hypothetical protein
MAQQRRPGNHNKEYIVYLVGATGTGKSTSLKGMLHGETRIIAWDPKGEYARLPGWKVFTSLESLRVALKGAKVGKFAFVPSLMSQFEMVCRLAFTWGACSFIGEELADVSTSSKAPQWWGILLRRGRDQAMWIFATSQRPAEADKTILGNYTRMRCHRLVSISDRDYVQKKVGIPRATLDAIQPFQWAEIDRAGNIKTGKTSK